MEIKNKIFKKFLWSFLATITILSGIWLWFAAWTASETEWSDTSFNDWQSITNNMLSASLMWYVKDSSWEKLYWRKFDNTSRSVNDAAKFCMDKWMWIPKWDQLSYYSAYNLKWLDYSAGKVWFQSMTSAWSYHKTQDMRWSQGTSCSTPGYSCNYYYYRIPNSRSSISSQWWYSTAYTVCVYKQW